MNRINRSIALAGIAGSFALAACGNSNGRIPADNTDRSAPMGNPTTNATPSTTQGGQTANTPPAAAPGNQTTAINQSNSSEHIDTTAEIRRAVMDDNTLSTGAKNSTIVTDGTGTVTLRGNVGTQAEKDAILAKAVAVVGMARVVNQLTVTP